MIKRLDKGSILNICVNQVIIDLATCVKELVENSLDAKSTKIEVHLKEYGREGIEVIDNGIGINSSNLDQIAQKGATSKLREFEDLDNLETFGFRGEALNAICVLSRLSITTCTEQQEIGSKYVFNQDNTLQSKSKKRILNLILTFKLASVARERGTTISLTDLFGSLPVRKQEFIKNIVSQYNKLVNLMTEYALIATHCQFCLLNTTQKKGREMIINSGQAPILGKGQAQTESVLMLNKISAVLTQKIANSLVDIEFPFQNGACKVSGFVLRQIESGSGRDMKFIQKNMTFMYVNSRPINPFKKVNNIFNEIYKKYNQNSKFIYILHLHVPTDSIDFNVSPDKRDVFFKFEIEFYTALRDHIIELFEKLNSMPKSLQFNKKKEDLIENDEMRSIEEVDNSGQNKKSLKLQDYNPPKQPILHQQKLPFQKIDDFDPQYFKENQRDTSRLSIYSNDSRKSRLLSPQDDEEDDLFRRMQSSKKGSELSLKDGSKQRNILQESDHYTKNSDYFRIADERKKEYEKLNRGPSNQSEESSNGANYKIKLWGAQEKIATVLNQNCARQGEDTEISSVSNIKNYQVEQQDPFYTLENKLGKFRQVREESLRKNSLSPSNNNISAFKFNPSNQRKEHLSDDEECSENNCHHSSKQNSPSNQNNKINSQESGNQEIKESIRKGDDDEIIQGIIDDEEQQEVIALNINQQFKKSDFLNLEILGQFNRAFIVAEFPLLNEVYLIDQHASDEKTNYEKLLRENKFTGQKLVVPIILPLTPQEADLLESYREVFTKNGFSFNIKNNSDQITLIVDQLPSSKHIQFDITDFDEIFQHLGSDDTDCSSYRPKKIQRVLASKACRSSIMVGKALTNSQMKNILINLSNLQSPWNCPHGRPTMVKTPSLSELCKLVKVSRKYDL